MSSASAPLSITSTLLLNDGVAIPRFGLGVYLNRGTSCLRACKSAIEDAGYKSIDTAQLYANEREVGQAVQESSTPRKELFITSKVWDSNHGYDRAMKSIDESLKASGLAYFDLFLIHSPNPGKEKRLEAYRALIEAKKQGKVRSIGVSNYGPHHIDEVVQKFPDHIPSLNQIELSPFFQRSEIVKKCQQHGIAVESYSPLGKGQFTDLPELKSIASRHGKTAAQVLIRWCLQRGFIVIPKSSNPSRIKENADIFDFELTSSDMQELDGMETGSGITWDPTLEP
ncbi:unnamed protein product [Parajaminaea phylloscopi]